MNKTVNINLGGMFFHIDEDAYQKLTRYFDAIKRSLSNSNGQDEIIKDIEMRIAELVTEKHSNDKQVINVKEVEEIIIIMGQPEDYRIDNDDDQPKSEAFSSAKTTKKLYRDKDKGMIGGVAAGLGHYFGIDAVWLRILLVILVFAGFGSGIIAYIVLWVVMPEAITTSEKLEMTGEPVTISNIEKKVREEFDNVSEKFKQGNYFVTGSQVKTGAEKAIGSLGEVFMSIFKVFAKILGVLLIMASLSVLVILFIGVFTVGSTAFIDLPWQQFIEAGNFSEYPVWVFGLMMFFAVGIPFFLLLILGFKLVSPNVKSIGNVAKYTLLALWLISLAILISLGIKQASEFATEGRMVEKQKIQIAPTDTLYVKFRNNDYFSKNDERRNFMVTEDSTDTKIIYSNDVRIEILRTDEKMPYLQIEKQAKGQSLSSARKTAQQIKYGFTITGNKLVLDNYLITHFSNKFRDQKIELYLYLPVGTYLKPEGQFEDYDNSDDDFFNLHFSGNYLYKVEKEKVKCLDCPADENDYEDVEGNDVSEDTTASVILNKDGILIKKSGQADENKEVKSVKINKDGIIIKTE